MIPQYFAEDIILNAKKAIKIHTTEIDNHLLNLIILYKDEIIL